MQIWDGLTPKRTDLSTVKATSHEDYLVIVQKIRELQEFTANLASNMDVMPNLDDLVNKAKAEIQLVKDQIDSLSLPEDVKKRLIRLEQDVLDVDQRAASLQLRQDFEVLKESVSQNQIKVLSAHSTFATDVKSFQNRVWGLLQTLKKETESKLEELATQVKQLGSKVELQASIDKFNNLNK